MYANCSFSVRGAPKGNRVRLIVYVRMYKLYVVVGVASCPGGRQVYVYVAYNIREVRRIWRLAYKGGCRNHARKSNFCLKMLIFIYFLIKNTIKLIKNNKKQVFRPVFLFGVIRTTPECSP